jgi:hypothetical protein
LEERDYCRARQRRLPDLWIGAGHLLAAVADAFGIADAFAGSWNVKGKTLD